MAQKANFTIGGTLMKKLLALFLAVVMTLSVGGVMAVAQDASLEIVIDGKKDAAYTDARMLDSGYWNFYAEPDGVEGVEPVDSQRVQNTVWFNWDDEFVYLYVLVESQDDLYVPQETPPTGYNQPSYMPNGEEEWKREEDCEYVRLFLDTAPSLDYQSPCRWKDNPGEGPVCNHFACAASDNSQTNDYRLMCRNYVAWDFWDDYYTANEGVFMDYEGWLSRRIDTNSPHYREAYTADPQGNYAANGGGNGEVASFIDYQTNTYGIEVKFRRDASQDHFQFNVITHAKYTEWEEEGPELPYLLSFCDRTYLNSQQLMKIYFADWDVENPVDPAVAAIQRQIGELPDPELLGKEHIDAVNKILADVEALTEEQAAQLTEADMEWLLGAAVKMELFAIVATLGKINDDDVVDAKDALFALKASVNKVELTQDQFLRADVTGDEKVDAKDALEMLQFAVRKRTRFSVEKLLEL